LKGAGDQEEEAHAVGAEMRALCGCRVVVAGLFFLAMMIAAVGCGTSFLGNYLKSLQDTGGSRFAMHRGKIEHDLFNGRYQKVEKEDWEDD
jgi:membrane protein implicated in regulation of membrane protease activity